MSRYPLLPDDEAAAGGGRYPILPGDEGDGDIVMPVDSGEGLALITEGGGPGPPGKGVPTGGAPGDALVKSGIDDFDTAWTSLYPGTRQLAFLYITNLDLSAPHPFGVFLPSDMDLFELVGQTDPTENGTYRTPGDPGNELLIRSEDQLLLPLKSGTSVAFTNVMSGDAMLTGAWELFVATHPETAIPHLSPQQGTGLTAQIHLTHPAEWSGGMTGSWVLITGSDDPEMDGLYVSLNGALITHPFLLGVGTRVVVESVGEWVLGTGGWLPLSTGGDGGGPPLGNIDGGVFH